jgi:hypothetical protein
MASDRVVRVDDNRSPMTLADAPVMIKCSDQMQLHRMRIHRMQIHRMQLDRMQLIRAPLIGFF